MLQRVKQRIGQAHRKLDSTLQRVPVIKRIILNKKFRIERKLIQHSHSTASSHPSILHFSVNKAATQYVKSIIQQCARVNNLVKVSLHDYAFHSDFPYLNTLSADQMQQYQHVFKPQGYAYSVFGGMIEGIPNFEQFLTILMLRDPRDVLVSEYYSVAYSHFAPSRHSRKYAQFIQLRQHTQTLSVDEYAMAQCDRVYATFARYQRLLVDQYPAVYITRFEEMVSDFPTWLSALLNYCELDIGDRLRQTLIENHRAIQPRQENAQRHLRKGAVGDYREKLNPETIDYIEAKLAPVLTAFHYE